MIQVISFLAIPRQKIGHSTHGPPTMTYQAFLIERHLRKSAVETVGHEYRVVPEPSFSASFFQYAPLHRAFEKIFTTVEQQRNYGTKPCFPVIAPIQRTQQLSTLSS